MVCPNDQCELGACGESQPNNLNDCQKCGSSLERVDLHSQAQVTDDAEQFGDWWEHLEVVASQQPIQQADQDAPANILPPTSTAHSNRQGTNSRRGGANRGAANHHGNYQGYHGSQSYGDYQGDLFQQGSQINQVFQATQTSMLMEGMKDSRTQYLQCLPTCCTLCLQIGWVQCQFSKPCRAAQLKCSVR